MEFLISEHEKLCRKGNLSKSVEDVQKTIDLLVQARDAIAENQNSAAVTLTKLQNPVKQSFENINSDLKEVYKGLNSYTKALDKKFKDRPFETTDSDQLSDQRSLVNRAIAMHLLREGDFSVASQFHTDASSKQPIFERQTEQGFIATETQSGLGIEDLRSENLRKQFGNMYHILEEMRKKRNLLPAIAWAETRRQQLDQRGSNLEFELQRLQFVWLFNRSFNSRDPRSLQDCQRQAIDYARQEFDHFQGRYLREIQQLIGAMAFSPNLRDSPYHNTFLDDDQWEHLATSFTREFCSLLGLSAESPLYIAATVGTIALPNLLKYQSIKGGPDREYQWTTSAELSVEIPLPTAYQFHSIFVCPVSKEQTTDGNPPMMMPCGHVVAQETLSRMSKGSRFKCPYCPVESRPEEAKKLYM